MITNATEITARMVSIAIVERFAATESGKLSAAALKLIQKPTEAQAEAGNYKKAHVRIHGLEVAIECAKGQRRKPNWPPLAAHYGYIKRYRGADGDHVDVFVGPDTESEIVVVVDQVNADGKFDEHKVLVGFPTTKSAVETYKKCYSPNWKVGQTTTLTIDQFKSWLKDGSQDAPAWVQVSKY
jgi:hypothetical protein